LTYPLSKALSPSMRDPANEVLECSTAPTPTSLARPSRSDSGSSTIHLVVRILSLPASPPMAL
jgi:hypothetical protein